MVSHLLFYQLTLIALVWLCVVAYPALADNSSGPRLNRPRGADQPVVRSRIGVSASHSVSLPGCRHTDPALLDDPLPAPSATALGVAAKAAPGSTAPL